MSYTQTEYKGGIWHWYPVPIFQCLSSVEPANEMKSLIYGTALTKTFPTIRHSKAELRSEMVLKSQMFSIDEYLLFCWRISDLCSLFQPVTHSHRSELPTVVSFFHSPVGRASCRIKVLPVTHGLVDKWVVMVKPVYKL